MIRVRQKPPHTHTYSLVQYTSKDFPHQPPHFSVTLCRESADSAVWNNPITEYQDILIPHLLWVSMFVRFASKHKSLTANQSHYDTCRGGLSVHQKALLSGELRLHNSGVITAQAGAAQCTDSTTSQSIHSAVHLTVIFPQMDRQTQSDVHMCSRSWNTEVGPADYLTVISEQPLR